MKKLSIFVILLALLCFSACSIPATLVTAMVVEEALQDTDEQTEPEELPAEEEPEPEPEQEDDTPTQEDLREQLEEDMGTSLLFSNSVRNDVTGRWRLTRYAGSANIVDYAADYYRAYFEGNDEVHFVINFSLKTTSVITYVGGNLYVTVHEYVDDEEHDAKVLPAGMVLADYMVDVLTGEATKL